MNSDYKFFIVYKGRDFLITVANKQVQVEYNGELTDQEYNELKRYLKLEGFLDQGVKYNII